jgi:ribonuclease HI
MEFKKAGKPWSYNEELQLIQEYSIQQMNLMDICKIHERFPGGITSRLVKLGIIDERKDAKGYSEFLKSDLGKEIKKENQEKYFVKKVINSTKLEENITKLKIKLEKLENQRSPLPKTSQSPQTPTKNAFDVLMTPKKMTKSNYIIYKGEENENAYRLQFDGKSEPNPGPSSAGAVIHYPNSEAVKAEVGEWIPNATNNEAEYKSLLIGLELAVQLGIKNILIAGDSNLVINQVFGDWKVKSENLREVNRKIKNFFKNFDFIAAKHVYRERNAYADNITNVVHEKKKGYLMKDGLYRKEIIIKGQTRELWSDEP